MTSLFNELTISYSMMITVKIYYSVFQQCQIKKLSTNSDVSKSVMSGKSYIKS